jgi:hypothetical protein
MKNKLAISFLTAIVVIATTACNFSVSTANLSSLKMTTDKAGTQETTTFKTGETFYAKAEVSNAGKVAVKFYLVADDAPGKKKGDLIPGSEVKVDLPSSGTASFNATFPASMAGKYTIIADMLNESGEKKDSKSVNFTMVAAAPVAEVASASAAASEKSDSKTEGKDGGKPDEKAENSK